MLSAPEGTRASECRRPSRIVRSVGLLFLTNVFLGGGMGLFFEYELRVIENAPLVGIGAGVLLANLATVFAVRALYRRAARLARGPSTIWEFLDDMLPTFLGVIGGLPFGVALLASAWNGRNGDDSAHKGNLIVLVFGVVTVVLGARAAVRLGRFVLETAGWAPASIASVGWGPWRPISGGRRCRMENRTSSRHLHRKAPRLEAYL